jgi:hypothetical protein
MRMRTIEKKMCCLVISIFLLITFSGCSGHQTSTTSYIQVDSKQVTKKDEYLVSVFDPLSVEKKKFVLKVHSRTTWNLIEEKSQYFATYYYYKSLDKGGTLEDIKIITGSKVQ